MSTYQQFGGAEKEDTVPVSPGQHGVGTSGALHCVHPNHGHNVEVTIHVKAVHVLMLDTDDTVRSVPELEKGF